MNCEGSRMIHVANLYTGRVVLIQHIVQGNLQFGYKLLEREESPAAGNLVSAKSGKWKVVRPCTESMHNTPPESLQHMVLLAPPVAWPSYQKFMHLQFFGYC